MDSDNVEVVRGYFEALNRWLVSYWSDPVEPLDRSPGVDDVFEHLAEEIEWDWVFTPETFRGREELLGAVEDWLDTVSDWRVEVEDLVEGSHDRVLLVGRVLARGKISGARVRQPLFSAITVRDGKVARMEDHTERDRGLAAAGLRDQSSTGGLRNLTPRG